jgi:hypothetical protein
MAIKVYRVYHIDSTLPANIGHLFSIVTDNDRASYAIPQDEKITDFAGLNQARIDTFAALEKEKPNDPNEWALVASQNMSMLDVIPVDAEYKTFEDAVEEESAKAEDAWYLRNIEFILPVTAAAEPCPPATQDIALNLENRKNAIDTAMYGPLNPEEPNDKYWQALANEWSVDVDTAKQQRCGNCAVFVVTTDMKNCIEQGLTGGERPDEFDAIDAAGELGYCEAFDFKCASARTCRAWVAGGPVDDSKAKEQ